MTKNNKDQAIAPVGKTDLELNSLCDRLQQQPNQRLRRKLGRLLMRQIVNLIDEPASGPNEARHLAAVDSAWAALEEAVYQHPEPISLLWGSADARISR
ncbi:MAG: hypothetical protein EA395_03885 [Phormidium sp. GEM2.Bin31]|nr:MAG: hypothetical protein EA395_03885 [Phormidium sp. GEM2.Bin31]